MTTERTYISDSEAYDVFVGGTSPEEFISGFISVQAAVTDFIEFTRLDQPYQEIPSWLEGALVRYIEKAIAKD
jgi:hypothetical protein